MGYIVWGENRSEYLSPARKVDVIYIKHPNVKGKNMNLEEKGGTYLSDPEKKS